MTIKIDVSKVFRKCLEYLVNAYSYGAMQLASHSSLKGILCHVENFNFIN